MLHKEIIIENSARVILYLDTFLCIFNSHIRFNLGIGIPCSGWQGFPYAIWYTWLSQATACDTSQGQK